MENQKEEENLQLHKDVTLEMAMYAGIYKYLAEDINAYIRQKLELMDSKYPRHYFIIKETSLKERFETGNYVSVSGCIGEVLVKGTKPDGESYVRPLYASKNWLPNGISEREFLKMVKNGEVLIDCDSIEEAKMLYIKKS